MQNSKILSLNEKDEWSYLLNKLPQNMQDVYYTPEYYELYEKYGDGKAFCFVFERENKLALYPFLKNCINDLGYNLDEKYYDIQGTYGYNGVVYSSDDSNFVNEYHNEFNRYCRENNIISEFTRFHPLLENQNYSKDHINISYSRQTIYINLTNTYEQISLGYSPHCKRNIRAAKKNNLSVCIYDKQWPYQEYFINLYQKTMKRLNSESYLFFDKDYFYKLFANNPIRQIVIFKDKTPIASAIFLYKGNYLHYHLGASELQYLSLRPNNLLFDEIIKYGLKAGHKILHLGGGRTSSKDDSLLRFKKGFSPATSKFFIGYKVHNDEVYKRVICDWGNTNPNLTSIYSNIFLRYRFFD